MNQSQTTEQRQPQSSPEQHVAKKEWAPSGPLKDKVMTKMHACHATMKSVAPQESM